jgi:phosphoenolpyruvate carboxylase
VTRLALEAAILRLDIDVSLNMLAEIFPSASDPAADCDYGEPALNRRCAACPRARRNLRPCAAVVRDGAGDRDSDHA